MIFEIKADTTFEATDINDAFLVLSEYFAKVLTKPTEAYSIFHNYKK